MLFLFVFHQFSFMKFTIHPFSHQWFHSLDAAVPSTTPMARRIEENVQLASSRPEAPTFDHGGSYEHRLAHSRMHAAWKLHRRLFLEFNIKLK